VRPFQVAVDAAPLNDDLGTVAEPPFRAAE